MVVSASFEVRTSHMHVVLFPVCVVLNFLQTQDGLKYCGEREVIFFKHVILPAG